MKALIAAAADLTDIDERYQGWTPLMEVSCRDYFELIPFLVKRGANINATTKLGNTALHLTTGFHSIHALMKYGADLEFKNNNGQTPLMYAIERYEVGTIRVLLDYGAKLSVGIPPELEHCWPYSILSKRKSLKQASLIFLALVKRTRVLSRDMRFVISSLLWTTRNNDVWLRVV